MPQGESFSIQTSSIQVLAQKPMLSLLILNLFNRLHEAPLDQNRIYIVDGKKYGQSKFRIKRRSGGDVLPDSDAFWFTKDETSKKIVLHCVIEIYRDEPDVTPLFVRNPQINLSYESAGKKIQKSLAITQSPMINEPMNILQDLHAETEVKWDEIKDVLIDLKDPARFAAFNLEITSELWWQRIQETPPPSTTDPLVFINPAILVGHIAEVQPKPRPAKVEAIRDLSDVSSKAMIMKGTNRGRFKFPVAEKLANETMIWAGHTQVDTTPQKIDLRHVIIKQYSKTDQAVFGPLSSEFELHGLNWKTVNIVKDTVPYTIFYRPTSQPDDFFFLPQTFRIKAKEQTGEPKITISMLAGDDPDKPETYRINIGITVVPYYNPKAKKDLYQTLDKESKQQIKFCKLRLGGYKSAQFKVREAFTGENAVFRGKIQETMNSIDPVNGFTLSVDCSLESFDFFKREITDGQWILGDIVFELISDGEGEESINTASIPVELDIRRLAGIPAVLNPIVVKNEEDKTEEIKGFKIKNNNDYPITVGGAEITLLSKIESTVYDADYDIGVQKSWPIVIEKLHGEDVLLKEEDVSELNGRFWTDLICEPYGISINTTPDEVLARVIDYATGDPQIWKLQISCPLFERWAELDEAALAPFKQVHRVDVEIKNEEGQIFSVQLDKTKPVADIEMARNINQILKSQQLSSRKYQYRVGTVYIINPTHWQEWKDPESTAGNFLSVIPQKLDV